VRGAVCDLDRLGVLHRYEPGGAYEIGLAQPVQGQVGWIVRVAEHRLEDLDLADAARPDLAHRQAVADLDKNRTLEHRGDRNV